VAGMTHHKIFAFAIGFLFFSSAVVTAQYQGEQQIGFTGLKAGSQPDPGIYITLPLYWWDHDVSIYDAQGNAILKQNVSAALNAFLLPSATVVTPFKILGATYGASFTQWILNGVLNVSALNNQFTKAGGYGYGDVYVVPATLGWHMAHGDVTAGYGFWAPTGAGIHGRHMWTNEIDFGATIYADHDKKWNVSTMMYYDIPRPKSDTDVTVGQIMTLSGGAGRSFLKGAANVGVVYGAQWKITHDSGSGIPALLPITNGRVFGVGPGVQMPVFAKGRNVGLVGFQYEWLVNPTTAFGGRVLTASFTFARLSQGH
jgi:hypothetical protein